MIDELEGKVIAGKYRIDSLLTDTGMGPVYRGSNILMDKPVTIKVLVPALAIDKRFVDRFLADAKAVSQAGHPNILNVLDFGTDTRDITYAVYEDAAGETLTELVARDNSLPVQKAIDIARQAARGLSSAHAQEFAHGALTPDKILVAKEEGAESVKVFEFAPEPVGKGSNAGVEYRAPETYDGGKPDERSDIYSLGVILYEMLSGVVPYIGKTAGELKKKQDSEPPPPLSAFRADLPPDLEPMILSATAIDPEKRYQTMKAFAEDLDLLSGGVPKTSAAAATAGAAPKHNVWQTAFIVLVGVAVLAIVMIYATSGKRSDPTGDLQADAGSLPVQPIGPATGAQEESLAKLPAMTAEEIMAFENSNTALPPGTAPGGDGYNAWGNGGVPPPGAPLTMGQQGERLSGDPNTQSPFMPGLDLVCKDVTTGQVIPCPTFDGGRPAPKASPVPKNPAGNANMGVPASTPKPMATPPTRGNPATGQPANTQPAKPSKPASKKPA